MSITYRDFARPLNMRSLDSHLKELFKLLVEYFIKCLSCLRDIIHILFVHACHIYKANKRTAISIEIYIF